MQGAYTQYRKSKGYNPAGATEQACALRKEEAILRLATIQNGKYKNYGNEERKVTTVKKTK